MSTKKVRDKNRIKKPKKVEMIYSKESIQRFNKEMEKLYKSLPHLGYSLEVQKKMMKARGYLPSYCEHALSKKHSKKGG